MAKLSDREYVAGISVNVVTISDVLAEIRSAVQTGQPCRVHTLNVDHVVLAHRDPDFARAIATANLVVPDGMPIVWVLRRRGHKSERITGVDLLERILRECPYRVTLVGARPGVAIAVAQKVQTHRWPADVVGTFAPPRADVLSKTASAILAGQIRSRHSDIVFVAFGAPLQEKWIVDHARDLGAPVVIGVGAAFDFLAGRLRRAPKAFQDRGLEWLYRMAQNPIRLGTRYVGRDWRFFPLLWRYGHAAAPFYGTAPVGTLLDQEPREETRVLSRGEALREE